MSENYTTINVVDFEYETSGGEFNLVTGDLPVVLCMVVYVLNENLQHIRTIRMWRGEFGSEPPFDIGPDALFVAYSAWAELTCFITLGWEFPVNVFDCHTAYLAASNILLPYNPDEPRKKQKKGLTHAARAYDIEGWERTEKGVISKDIGEGRWRDHGQPACYGYCEEDVRVTALLFRKQLRGYSGQLYLRPADVDRVPYWSNYSAKAVALVQARGMLIDVPMWNAVQENKAAIITALLRKFDPSYGTDTPIYSPEGQWSYKRFEEWLIGCTDIIGWPRLGSDKLDISGDAFRIMYPYAPWAKDLHALRDSLGVIVKAKLPIGRDGRNRPSLFPFATASGRNAHTRSLYNAHAAMRGFMVFPEDKTGLYLDFRTQEVGVAAGFSGDQQLIADYLGGDVYYGLAKLCGQTFGLNLKDWKREKKDVRDLMKSLQLGVNYGMGVPSLARGLKRHPQVASGIIELHKRTYPRFWEWRESVVQEAMFTRQMETVWGWPLYLTNSPNKRTLYNFPCQGGGAEMLRLATTRLCDAGIIPNMLVHDAVLLELDNQEQKLQAIEIMKSAGRDVCNGLEIGVGVDQELTNGARYADGRDKAKDMWKVIENTLQEVGAISNDEPKSRCAGR